MLKKERNAQIVAQILSGEKTTGQLAVEHTVTRQRIHSIFIKTTGKRLGPVKEKLKAKRRVFEGERLAYMCRSCGTQVLNKDRDHGQFLCKACLALARDRSKDIYHTRHCQREGCPNEFHPYRNYKYLGMEQKYCSQKCYFTARFGT